MFAGRITRSVPERYGPKPCWPQTQFPSVITSAPAARIRSAIFAVIPRPSAAFSPFTMQKSTASSSRRPRQLRLDSPPSGRAEDVGDEEDPQSEP